ncbi:hypothetical protein D8B45_06375 [Candidatus Gracilibacteria bacterium]|nr:MAG: hypothetical protein D8B45_06375 [Candidatus Gracilibacteria bacterium]
MKIFSNFNTERKKEAYSEAVEKFGEKNIFVLKKSFLFLLVKFLIPVLGWTLLFTVLDLTIFFGLSEFGQVRRRLLGAFSLSYLIVISPLLKYYIDYTMDFSIITPEYLTRYNQSGIMARDIKTSNVMNIKTISIEKHSFLYNIFNNGDLIFLSEGDKADQGEIVLHYIKNPEGAKKEITRIMKLPL